ncbi:Slam-dependent surface lipoprotein [Sphingomonas sp. 2SG]|uniref:Slam-dependent surface lipoprotein n=1 Tax=Sphingomonas sp. 2SG TaxID=2502201 RepID=UPI0010F79DA4|nr:Slam-dependent surface lipoprotein [Sphingomonas sp. 2SG]
MKMTNLKLFAASAALAMAFAGTAHAQDVDGGTSDRDNNRVGVSSAFGPSHPTAGKAGLSAKATGINNFVAFQDLKGNGSTDLNGVTTINNPTTGPDDHRNLGLFHFAQVGNDDVWFGEWSSNASSGSTDHTVYYAGTTTGTTVPTSGSATYAVRGISDYANKGLLTGTFTANFASGSSGTLTGGIANSASGYGVNIGTAAINGVTFSGSSASATQSGTTVASGGAVKGQFYGANAAALAGIATFGSARQYDTAFGGTKN